MSYYTGALLLVIAPIVAAVLTAAALYHVKAIREGLARWIEQ